MARRRDNLVVMVLLAGLSLIAGFPVEVSELVDVNDFVAIGMFDAAPSYAVDNYFGGVDPIGGDCGGSRCVGLQTRDGSRDLDSMYSCIQPAAPEDVDSFRYGDDDSTVDLCSVTYNIAEYGTPATISALRIALHPESVSDIVVLVDGEAVLEWSGAGGTTEWQDVSIIDGYAGYDVTVQGVLQTGDFFGILEVEVDVYTSEVEVLGASAGTRDVISVTATSDVDSAENTLDGDMTESSKWTCLSGDVCELTYDLGVVESLEQLRVAFSDMNEGGEITISAAGESAVYSVVNTIQAGGRPAAEDGLETHGGIRALARYIKLSATPVAGGMIAVKEVEFRVSEIAPARPVKKKSRLTPTGDLPRASAISSSSAPRYDGRNAASGGCDSPSHFEGCNSYYIKDGDISDDSRWSCGPLATAEWQYGGDCGASFNLNTYRYVRQIQLAFYLGDEQHDEFSIEAMTVDNIWEVVVPSVITSGDTTDYQTFDLKVFTNAINIVPKFQRVDQWINIKEMVLLERPRDYPGITTVPMFNIYPRPYTRSSDEDAQLTGANRQFKIRLFDEGDQIWIRMPEALVSGFRMKFPVNRQFTFEVEYYLDGPSGGDITQRFTSGGGERMWETFTFAEPVNIRDLFISAVEGPNVSPTYPVLKAGGFHVIGEPTLSPPGTFKMVTTTSSVWGVLPDIIGTGAAEQQQIMTIICEAKGAAFDGTDCVGELNDSSVVVDLQLGEFFVDGPIFMKSGVTLKGKWSGDSPNYTMLVLYRGVNNGNTAEDAVLVYDGVSGAVTEEIFFEIKDDYAEGDIVPGNIGNICMDVRNSEDLRFAFMYFNEARAGAARFTDSTNITAIDLWGGTYETGNYMELTRVDDFTISSFPDMQGVLIDSCNNHDWIGRDEFEVPDPMLSVPTGGSQTANLVVTGDSTEIVFSDFRLNSGAEPRILMQSTSPLVLSNAFVEEGVSGECLVEVPADTPDDIVAFTTSDGQTVSRSGNCYVLD